MNNVAQTLEKLAKSTSQPHKEGTNAVYKKLLESTKAIPWKIDWKSMRIDYIGPQIESLLGWSPASLQTAQDWAQKLHPDDAWVADYYVAQSKAGNEHGADYRIIKKNGTYVWITDLVNVVRDSQGEVESLVGLIFDISERKKTEEELMASHKELEALSFTDSLTGAANRRMFDSILGLEWLNARRTGQPLSLIMIDIDYFKQYNDHYGTLKVIYV